MNSLYQQLNPQAGSPSSQNNLKNLFNSINNSKNPQQMLNNLAKSNPQLKSVLDLVQNSKMSPKDLFYFMAKQKGINPEDILKQLR